MSVTASPARVTADSAAATNDRPAGNRRNSDVCDKNTRRGGGRSPDMTHSIPALTPDGQPATSTHQRPRAPRMPFPPFGGHLYRQSCNITLPSTVIRLRISPDDLLCAVTVVESPRCITWAVSRILDSSSRL